MRVVQIFLVLSFLSSQALAEYRAFELKISKKSDPTQFRLLTSTLDPFQYAGYFIVKEDELVQYTRSWMCRGSLGRTSEQPICPDPNQVPEAEAPLAEQAPSGPEPTAPIERAPASN